MKIGKQNKTKDIKQEYLDKFVNSYRVIDCDNQIYHLFLNAHSTVGDAKQCLKEKDRDKFKDVQIKYNSNKLDNSVILDGIDFLPGYSLIARTKKHQIGGYYLIKLYINGEWPMIRMERKYEDTAKSLLDRYNQNIRIQYECDFATSLIYFKMEVPADTKLRHIGISNNDFLVFQSNNYFSYIPNYFTFFPDKNECKLQYDPTMEMVELINYVRSIFHIPKEFEVYIVFDYENIYSNSSALFPCILPNKNKYVVSRAFIKRSFAYAIGWDGKKWIQYGGFKGPDSYKLFSPNKPPCVRRLNPIPKFHEIIIHENPKSFPKREFIPKENRQKKLNRPCSQQLINVDEIISKDNSSPIKSILDDPKLIDYREYEPNDSGIIKPFTSKNIDPPATKNTFLQDKQPNILSSNSTTLKEASSCNKLPAFSNQQFSSSKLVEEQKEAAPVRVTEEPSNKFEFVYKSYDHKERNRIILEIEPDLAVREIIPIIIENMSLDEETGIVLYCQGRFLQKKDKWKDLEIRNDCDILVYEKLPFSSFI